MFKFSSLASSLAFALFVLTTPLQASFSFEFFEKEPLFNIDDFSLGTNSEDENPGFFLNDEETNTNSKITLIASNGYQFTVTFEEFHIILSTLSEEDAQDFQNQYGKSIVNNIIIQCNLSSSQIYNLLHPQGIQTESKDNSNEMVLDFVAQENTVKDLIGNTEYHERFENYLKEEELECVPSVKTRKRKAKPIVQGVWGVGYFPSEILSLIINAMYFEITINRLFQCYTDTTIEECAQLVSTVLNLRLINIQFRDVITLNREIWVFLYPYTRRGLQIALECEIYEDIQLDDLEKIDLKSLVILDALEFRLRKKIERFCTIFQITDPFHSVDDLDFSACRFNRKICIHNDVFAWESEKARVLAKFEELKKEYALVKTKLRKTIEVEKERQRLENGRKKYQEKKQEKLKKIEEEKKREEAEKKKKTTLFIKINRTPKDPAPDKDPEIL